VSGPADAAAAPAVPAEGALARVLRLRQASVLTSRYVDLKLGDLGGLALTLLQAPLIGWLIGLAFDDKPESQRIDFILAVVAVWLGCFNACREVVKERPIFLRERRAGVSVRAYVLSKLLVLSVIAAVQCLVLLIMVARAVRLSGALPLMYLALLTTTLSATALGLLISSVVTSQNSLIALVPIVLIPQLIFSEVTLGNANEVVQKVERAMVADWGYRVLNELRKASADRRWSTILEGEAVLAGMGLGLLVLAVVCLKAQEE
jgi:hypothetical protein